MNTYNTVRLSPHDRRTDDALDLAERVFREVCSPLYSPEGAEGVIAFIRGEPLRTAIGEGQEHIYVCCEGDVIAGMMSVSEKGHISLAFVDREHRGRGVGSALLERVSRDMKVPQLTVNAASSAYGFYIKRGFVPLDMERLDRGIVYTPMSLKGRYMT